jgi:hypothetical protein
VIALLAAADSFEPSSPLELDTVRVRNLWTRDSYTVSRILAPMPEGVGLHMLSDLPLE